MARPSKKLIDAIRKTAKKLKGDSAYQWGHMGACNCGNLVQELTSLSKGEIHEYAMRGRGDWTEQIEAFCPTSEMPMDLLISQLIAEGLSLEDLINLERLKDREVLARFDSSTKNALSHNNRNDVALYMEKWADHLESRLNSKLYESKKEVHLT